MTKKIINLDKEYLCSSYRTGLNIDTREYSIRSKNEKILSIIYWDIEDYCNKKGIDLTRD